MADNRYVKERWGYQVRDEKVQEAKAAAIKAKIEDATMNDSVLLKLLRKSPRR